jgi:2-polyprenyl-3-methyl-5-hydroxy-6-metoxy-1,4-benzoquinol methylase
MAFSGWLFRWPKGGGNSYRRVEETSGLGASRVQARLRREIEHGRYLAGRCAGEIWNWETPAGRFRWKRRVRMLTNHVGPGTNVLELGCGTGYFTKELAHTGANVSAIDISPDLLEEARRNCPAPNVTFEIQNAYALSYPDASFDSVVGSSVLHHLEIDEALRQIYRVLKPGGLIHFTEPNMLNPQIAVQKNVPAVKKRLGDSPDETAFFRWGLRRRLERARFREVRIDPFEFLHPKTPPGWIPTVQSLSSVLERIPLLREVAGSLYIRAVK